jgi:hypothetical protein
MPTRHNFNYQMFKRKQIRKEFDDANQSGDEASMNQMLEKYPWLVAEWESRLNNSQGEQQIVLAAMGVMEDELAQPVPLQDVTFCLRVDFRVTKQDQEVLGVIQEAESLGYCQKVQNGYVLTEEGGRICDDYLNAHLP